MSARRPQALKSARVHDVIVLGSQLPGVLAGALLARRGLRVLHVDHDGVFDRYEDGGYAFPYEPALLPPLDRIPAAAAALEELGLTTDVRRKLEPYPQGLQVLLPRARVDLGPTDALRSRELSRAFGEEGGKLSLEVARSAALLDAAAPLLAARPPLPPDGLMERFALRRMARRAGKLLDEAPPLDASHPLGAALLGLWSFASYLDEPPTAFAFARTVAPLLLSPCRYPGGREGLVETLRGAMRTAGADLLGEPGQPAIAEELLLEGGRFAGVKLLGDGAVHRARVCIAATDAAALRRLVPPSRRQRKLSDLADAVRARRFLFTVNRVLREEAIPPGLASLALLSGLPGMDGPVLLQVAPAQRVNGPVPGKVTVTASTFVPSSIRDLGQAAMEETASKLVAMLHEVLPFHERHLSGSSAPYLAAVGSRGSRLLPHPLLEVSLPRRLSVTGLPVRAPIGRLLFASREVLPGLGLEGEFLAGLRAAELAAEMGGKVDPLS